MEGRIGEGKRRTRRSETRTRSDELYIGGRAQDGGECDPKSQTNNVYPSARASERTNRFCVPRLCVCVSRFVWTLESRTFCALCAFLGIAIHYPLSLTSSFFVLLSRCVLSCFCCLICSLCSLVFISCLIVSLLPLFSSFFPPGLRVALSNNVVASRPSCARVSAQPHSPTPVSITLPRA